MEFIFGTWRVSVERIPPSTTELIAMYNHAARYWQRGLQRLGYPHAYKALFTRLQTDGWLPQQSGGIRVLDAGIGTAAFSVALASTWNAPLRLDGVDMAPAMLEEARCALERRGVAAQLHQANICALPFAQETFDLVISAHVLEHLAHPEIGLRELVRVLRPGAPLLLVVTTTRPHGWINALEMALPYDQNGPTSDCWLEEAGVAQVASISVDTWSFLASLDECSLYWRKGEPIEVWRPGGCVNQGVCIFCLEKTYRS